MEGILVRRAETREEPGKNAPSSFKVHSAKQTAPGTTLLFGRVLWDWKEWSTMMETVVWGQIKRSLKGSGEKAAQFKERTRGSQHSRRGPTQGQRFFNCSGAWRNYWGTLSSGEKIWRVPVLRAWVCHSSTLNYLKKVRATFFDASPATWIAVNQGFVVGKRCSDLLT